MTVYGSLRDRVVNIISREIYQSSSTDADEINICWQLYNMMLAWTNVFTLVNALKCSSIPWRSRPSSADRMLNKWHQSDCLKGSCQALLANINLQRVSKLIKIRIVFLLFTEKHNEIEVLYLVHVWQIVNFVWQTANKTGISWDLVCTKWYIHVSLNYLFYKKHSTLRWYLCFIM